LFFWISFPRTTSTLYAFLNSFRRATDISLAKKTWLIFGCNELQQNVLTLDAVNRSCTLEVYRSVYRDTLPPNLNDHLGVYWWDQIFA
jgi:hypothetical protein